MDALVRYRRDIRMALEVGRQLRRWIRHGDDFGLRFRLPALATALNMETGELPSDIAHDFGDYVENWDAAAMLFLGLPLLRSPLESRYEHGVQLLLEAVFLEPGLWRLLLGRKPAPSPGGADNFDIARVCRAWELVSQERPDIVQSLRAILRDEVVDREAATLGARRPQHDAGYEDASAWHQSVRGRARDLARGLSMNWRRPVDKAHLDEDRQRSDSLRAV
jgi:hypothetical protein